ncbi:hypothetical protein M407DRAFT_25716 [Tulasnella calospora MUT 4182]|uniref:Protein kinase domain-containing protein n=1 Tax=Tulasnella calospora MUT 4182 TaxID=1051891 RepID=A0A0C3QH34_9AGAM|nr:hypothetical protein M407DRAFT_25716 [Tulasnella calospora MUT 4182]
MIQPSPTPVEFSILNFRKPPDSPPRTRIAQPFQYLLDDLLCDARDLLFCRSTRVWRAQLITDTGLSPQYNAIKQSWHDEARTNEAWFYEETKDIELGIAHMLHFEDVCRTRYASLSARPNDVRATWTQPSEDRIILERKEKFSTLRTVSHRALIRIVLKEVSRPLSQLKTPRQLVHVLRDIAFVLEALYDRNILHRDISEGNILLSPEENPDPGNRAFLTDFGLAARIDPITKFPLRGSMKQNHVTGTLPLVAAVLHQATPDFTPLSTIHNDVESLFWVTMYTLLNCATCESYPDMSKSEEADIRRCRGLFAQLQSPEMTALFAVKRQIILFGAEVRLPGWVALRAFLAEDHPNPKEHNISAIVIEADAVGEGSGESLDVLAP